MRLFVDNLTVIDCSYLDMKRGLVGESWMVDIELEGALDDQNMIMDFGKAKRAIKDAIDDTIDHTLIVPTLCDNVKIEKDGDRSTVTFEDVKGHKIVHGSPHQAITAIESERIDDESVTKYLVEMLQKVVSANAKDVRVKLRTKQIDGYFYHYSHGLKKHDGNCQRIAHGHRSRIYIDGNGARASKWEHHWSDVFKDIYIGTKEDIVDTTEIHGTSYIHFEYTSAQGLYTLQIPEERCYLMDHDTTVELIARHIAEETLEQSCQESFFVRAYEGVGKGAIFDTNELD